MKLAFVVLAAAFVAAAAEPPRSTEVFAQIGSMRLGGDEGSAGTAVAFGGAVTAPLTSRWALDAALATARPDAYDQPPGYFSVRRLLVSPALVRRFGNQRVLGFAGVGLGLQSDNTHSRHSFYAGDPPQMTGITEVRTTQTGWTLLARVGVVGNPWSDLLVRADVELSWRYVLPNVVGRIGVGWRFGR